MKTILTNVRKAEFVARATREDLVLNHEDGTQTIYTDVKCVSFERGEVDNPNISIEVVQPRILKPTIAPLTAEDVGMITEWRDSESGEVVEKWESKFIPVDRPISNKEEIE